MKHQRLYREQNTYLLLVTQEHSLKCDKNTQNFQMDSHCQARKRKNSKDCCTFNNKTCNKTYEKKTWMSSLERENKNCQQKFSNISEVGI